MENTYAYYLFGLSNNGPSICRYVITISTMKCLTSLVHDANRISVTCPGNKQHVQLSHKSMKVIDRCILTLNSPGKQQSNAEISAEIFFPYFMLRFGREKTEHAQWLKPHPSAHLDTPANHCTKRTAVGSFWGF